MTSSEFSERFEYDPDNDLLGEGGFGEIFKAYDTMRNEYVALKVAKVLPGQDEFSLLSEYRRIAGLRHPNISIYHECDRIKIAGLGTRDVALMKYYEHGNLAQLLAKTSLTDPQKQKLVEGLMEGLNYLHHQKPLIIHSDLKPPNILIVERNGFYIPLITDFGISRQAHHADKTYVTNTVGAGTLIYAAPEQWEARELRPNADLWSLGIVAIYIYFNGKKLPFRSDDLNTATEAGRIEFMKRIVALDFIPDVKTLPEFYRNIIEKCLVVDPTARAKTIGEISGKTKPEKKGTEAAREETLIMPDKAKTQKAESPLSIEIQEKTKVLEPEVVVSKIVENPAPPPDKAEAKKIDPIKPAPAKNRSLMYTLAGLGAALLLLIVFLTNREGPVGKAGITANGQPVGSHVADSSESGYKPMIPSDKTVEAEPVATEKTKSEPVGKSDSRDGAVKGIAQAPEIVKKTEPVSPPAQERLVIDLNAKKNETASPVVASPVSDRKEVTTTPVHRSEMVLAPANITEADKKEVRIQARDLIQTQLPDLLNLLTSDYVNESEKQTVIFNSYIPSYNQIFYNDRTIIEDDIDPENTINKEGPARSIQKYLDDLKLFYTKSSASSIRLSDVAVGQTYQDGGHLSVKVVFKTQFLNKHRQKATSYVPVYRVAELRADKPDKKWIVMITSIRYYR